MKILQPARVALCLLAACIAHAGAARAAEDLPTFVTGAKHTKPTFAPGDEQFARDFAKSNGVEFSQSMELPSCIWRTRTRTAGGFMDGFSDDGKFKALVRVPVAMADVALRNVHMYGDDYPRTAYFEMHDRMEGYAGKREGWEAVLVLPPLKDPQDAVGPRFDIAVASFGGVAGQRIKFYQMPGLQTRIYIGPIAKALAGSEPLKLSVMLQNIVAASDTAAPSVSVNTTFPDLRADLAKAAALLEDMQVRDRAKQCSVLGSTCRDGECK
ncbi:hypothetical protein [Massilia glaciei]|nr:hypothetical protein [Massilia glaciei]